jgi:hypothetical protein
MRYLHFDVGDQQTGAVVEASIRGSESDVFLVDSSNFQRFKRGDNFEYFGGHYDRSPVRLPVPHSGHWTAVVIPTGGRVQASVQVF